MKCLKKCTNHNMPWWIEECALNDRLFYERKQEALLSKICLDNMIDIKVNNDRVKSRAKRLGVKVTDIRKIRRGH